MSISEELGEELDELTEECVDLQASRSEVVEAILTAYFQSDVDHEHESASSSSAAEKESSDWSSSRCSGRNFNQHLCNK